MISFKELIDKGVHFGHQTSRWNPKMDPYIWGHRNGVHLIDIAQTAYGLERAARFLEEVASQGKPILWVGTKKPAQPIIKEVADGLNQPYVIHRWIGGLLTNFLQVKKSVGNLLHFEDIIAKADQFPYTKKEMSVLQKNVDRLEKSVGGIRSLTWPVGAIVVVDVRKERTVLREALESGVPVVAIVDTNGDPSGIDYVVPGNDDSPKSIALLMNYLKEYVERGQKTAAQAKLAAKKEREAQAAEKKKGAADKDASVQVEAVVQAPGADAVVEPSVE